MPLPTLFAPDDLFDRLSGISRGKGKLGYCVGSGLTSPVVPGVERVLPLMKHALGSAPAQGEAFDAAVGDQEGGAAYQAAANLIIGRRGQIGLNQFVREMALQAHRPTLSLLGSDIDGDDLTDDYCERAEFEADAWYMPDAVTRFAQLLVAESTSHQALVVTTNFDPLIEIAVRQAGGNPVTLSFEQDGRLGDLVPARNVVVAHLHGFWRDSDTLHVPAQLEQERPSLQRSLEGLLGDRTLIVSGYGGWDDVFTAALTEAVRHHQRGELSVLWVFREPDPGRVAARQESLLTRFGSATGHLQFYCGCTCERVFELVEEASAGDGEDPRSPVFFSPLPGWSAITPQFLDRQKSELSAEELCLFFDGQVPSWRHAQSDAIPRLAAARAVIAAVEEGSTSNLSVVLLQGPSGEGKSAALLQAAAHFGRREEWRVLRREIGADATFEMGALERGDWRWLLVIDEAGADAGECLAAVRRMHEEGRDDVTLLLSAQIADWRDVRAQAMPWSELALFKVIDARGLESEDARAVVEGWEAAGTAGLGQLVGLPDREQRAAALIEAARNEALNPEGSFFGAMLRVRVGEALRDHVRTLGERLRGRHTASGQSLLQAFLYVASLHSHGVLSLQPATFAEALGIPPGDLYREMLWPLGEEAAVTRGGVGVRVRHRAIAEVAMELLDDWGEDPAQIYYEIIGAAARVRHGGATVPELAKIVYLPGRLTDQPRVAKRAALAPVEVEPARLNYGTSLVSVLRKCGAPEEGLKEAQRVFELADVAPDPENLRGLLHEWGVCAGLAEKFALNAYLCLSSISDDLPHSTKTASNKDFAFASRGVIESLTKLAGKRGDPAWGVAARAAAEQVAAAAEGERLLEDADSVIAVLGATVEELTPLIEDALPKSLSPDLHPLTFKQLKRLSAEAG